MQIRAFAFPYQNSELPVEMVGYNMGGTGKGRELLCLSALAAARASR